MHEDSKKHDTPADANNVLCAGQIVLLDKYLNKL